MRCFQFAITAFVFLACFIASAPARAMTFTHLPSAACGAAVCIAATGAIEGDTGKAFKSFCDRDKVPAGAVVMLSSEGGNLVGGLSLGREIRSGGFSTAVASYDTASAKPATATCASACVWAFLGGEQRSIANNSKLGVHQVRFDIEGITAVADAQWLMGQVAVHVKKMGAASDVLTLALTTSPDHIRWLSAEELKRYAVVT